MDALTQTAPERIWLNESIAKLYGTVGSDHIPTVPYIREDKAPQWKPIESAPQDGSWFWAWSLSQLAVIKVQYRQKERFWYDTNHCSREVTHWMPLPTPPASEKPGK